MEYIGHWLNVISYKHDGTLHRVWDRGLVLENNDDFIVVASKKAKVIETNGRRWFTKEPAVTIFSKKEWWNVICMIKDDGICYYCNIASPSIIHKESILYIDYDLDAKLYPNHKVIILDEKEYTRNKDIYSYSEKLDTVLNYYIKSVTDMMRKQVFPFNDLKIKQYYEKFLSMLPNKKSRR